MKRAAYDSPAVPISWKRIQYVSGTREGVRVVPDMLSNIIEYYKDEPEALEAAVGKNPYELKNIIDKWILSENSELQCIPTDSIVITIDKDAVRRSGMMIPNDSIPDVMHISLKGRNSVYKSELMMYEMLVGCNWERPMYVAVTVGEDNYGSLGKNFVQEGLANRITPFDTEQSGLNIDTEKMYDNLMNRFRFGGLNNPNIYLDETVLRMCYTHRRMFAMLGLQLLKEDKKDQALKLMQKCEKEIPESTVPHSWKSGSLDIARIYATLGQNKKAEHIATKVAIDSKEYLDWYLSLNKKQFNFTKRDCSYYLYQLRECIELLYASNSPQADTYGRKLLDFQQKLEMRLNPTGS